MPFSLHVPYKWQWQLRRWPHPTHPRYRYFCMNPFCMNPNGGSPGFCKIQMKGGRTPTRGHLENPRIASMIRPTSWSWGKRCPCPGPKSTLGQSGQAQLSHRGLSPTPMVLCHWDSKCTGSQISKGFRVLDVKGFSEDSPVAPIHSMAA